MRLYTFISACLEFLEISNIRLYANIYALKRFFGISWNFKYTLICVYIRFHTQKLDFKKLKYTLIYAYIRFFSVDHDWKIYAYMRISESGQYTENLRWKILPKIFHFDSCQVWQLSDLTAVKSDSCQIRQLSANACRIYEYLPESAMLF